ncbi:chromate transport protein [Phenylobacterium sp.]|uniref:chromate transport protein n=1 Tax=Phenylobacterium sp. TaxID=1871053 RepID=UPI0035C797DF
MGETPDPTRAGARPRLTRLALLAAAAVSGASGGVVYGLGSASGPGLLAYMLGGGTLGLLVGVRPAFTRRSPPLALSLIALALGGMAAVHGGGASGALGPLSALAAGAVAGGVLRSTLARLERTANGAAHLGSAWMLPVFAGAAASYSLRPSMAPLLAAALAVAGHGLLHAAGHDGRAPDALSDQAHRRRQALNPHVLLAVAGGGLGLALAGLAAPTAAGQTVTAAGLLVAAAVGAFIGVAVGEMLRRRARVARLGGAFGCAALGFILLQGALSAPFALAAAALIGAGLAGLAAPLFAWRQSVVPNCTGCVVAALFLGQAAGVLAWTAASASPLPYGAAYVVMATLLGLAAFASAGAGAD